MEEVKTGYTAYRMDYSVYVLRNEMRDMGKQLSRNEDSWSNEHKAEIRSRMQQIRDTLSMLKEKLIN